MGAAPRRGEGGDRPSSLSVESLQQEGGPVCVREVRDGKVEGPKWAWEGSLVNRKSSR